MFYKFKNILCHPSRIGMYILDRFTSIIGYFFFFFVITTCFFAANDLSKTKFNGNTANAVVDVLLKVDTIKDTTFKDKKLTGTKEIIDTEGVRIYFNDSAHLNQDHGMKLILVFSQSEANAYYSSIHLGKIIYAESEIQDFTFEEIHNKSIANRLELETIIQSLLNASDGNFRALYFWQDLLNMLLFYAVALFLCYVVATIANNTIEPKFRKKLVVYDSLIYFFGVWLSILYDVSWLLYFGIFLACVYTVITFSHIRAIPIKKGENV